MPLRTREARAERISYEETLKARLARLEAHYERLDEGKPRIEAEMEIEGTLVEMPLDAPVDTLVDNVPAVIEPHPKQRPNNAVAIVRESRDKHRALMSDVTSILLQIEQGDPQAAAKLLPLVYDELRRLAAERMAAENPGQTLSATALVHEAYLRLAGNGEATKSPRWDSRGHFFAAAAEAMRRILIDNARRKKSQKRGRGAARIELDQVGDDGAAVAFDPDPHELLALDEALDALEKQDAPAAALAKLRYLPDYPSMTPPRRWEFPEPPASAIGHTPARLKSELRN